MADNLVIADIVPPGELVAFVNRLQEELPINRQIGRQFFPTQFTPSDRWETTLQSARDWTGELEYRAWNTEPTFHERPGVMRIRGNIAPIGGQMMLQEDYIREFNRAGQRGVSQQLIDQVFNDAATLLRKAENRLERARWEALDLGTFTIGASDGLAPFTENGLVANVDFQRAAGNRFDVATKWDQGGSTPFTDELALVEGAQDAGIDLDTVIMPNDVIRTLMNHQEYRDLFRTIRVVPRLTPGDFAAIRQDYGLPNIIPMTASGQRRTTPGGRTETVVRYLDKRVIYLPSSTQVGATMWGPSSYEGMPEIGSVAPQGGPVVFTMRSLAPPVIYTVLDAVAIPVLFNPNDTYSVGVLT